jgi:PAS domain S-box-containing protein
MTPRQSALFSVYLTTRFWLSLAGTIVIAVLGALTGWQRGAWMLAITAVLFAHALFVLLTGTGRSVFTLLIDGTVLGINVLSLALPVVTVAAITFYVAVVVIFARRRAAVLLTIYAIGWAAVGLIADYLEWFDPLTHDARVAIEIAVATFFVAALALVIARITKEADRLEAERRDIAEALEQKERRFRTMVEHAFDGVAILSMAGDLLYVSSSIERILGFRVEQRLGRPMHDIVVDEDVPMVLGELARIATVPEGTAQIRARVNHADGSVRVLEVIGHNMAHEASVGGVVANFRDVTEEAAAQAALEDSNERLARLVRSKDEFVASVSHELRTPLTAVLGLAEELRDHSESFSPEEQQDLRNLTALQAREVAAIVEDLLVAARADIGEVSVFADSFDLAVAVDDVVAVLESTDSVQLAVARPLMAYADPGRCRQVVRNLLTNALRYGGHRVRVDGWSEDGFVHLAVRDDGPGLTEGEAEQVFQPYESVHAERTQPASIGLGLTVSRQLARLMDGDLVYSHDGEWSSFELTIPKTAAD